MAVKKSELYSSLWASCDELRGGMDASQYKDYVLVMLFVKYISDKYSNTPYAPITVPKGASFVDMVNLKGKPDIGDQINKKILEPIASANKLVDMPDFNDPNKLGSGKEMVDRLTNLVAIFEDKRLDFSKNRAEGDDLMGDAYEYLMRHFAVDSGKSKGQFLTPAEVSRIMAQIIGINPKNSKAETTVYDPTCGSGSLLLKVAHQAQKSVSLFGQEKDSSTAGLARMNMILHNNPTAVINQGNTLANPLFLDDNSQLKRFDYVVANPPFSDKRWSNGVDAGNDPFDRFDGIGIPPEKNGDFAFLLHILKSLKSTGKGICVLPHGVLFRGGAEAAIRQKLLEKGYIKGIIGLPANLFYGTGIPACLIVLDKENAHNRKGLFIMDASKGFMKDGPKNRLRSQDIYRIVEVFNQQRDVPQYARTVHINEIENNDYNLNIPRYIDSQEAAETHDIVGHLKGEIPKADVEALDAFWKVFPSLKQSLFTAGHAEHYLQPALAQEDLKDHIFKHPEFTTHQQKMNAVFADWCTANTTYLKGLETGCHPRQIIHQLAESLLKAFKNRPLVNRYHVYQHLMDYWDQTLQDDAYLIALEGWKAETYRQTETTKTGKERTLGWTCDLLPKPLIVNRYFAKEQAAIDTHKAQLDQTQTELQELEEAQSSEEGLFADWDKINAQSIKARLRALQKENKKQNGVTEPAPLYGENQLTEEDLLEKWLKLNDKIVALKKQIRQDESKLDSDAYNQYPELSEEEIKSLAVDDKWMAHLQQAIQGEMDALSQQLASQVKALCLRYQYSLSQLEQQVETQQQKVLAHLQKMGMA